MRRHGYTLLLAFCLGTWGFRPSFVGFRPRCSRLGRVLCRASSDADDAAIFKAKEAVGEMLEQLAESMEGEPGQLRAQALRLRWDALCSGKEEDPWGQLQDAREGVLEANQAFYACFNSRDLDAMSDLWASSVSKWGPLLFFNDKEDACGITCVCTHPDSSRVVGRSDILTSWFRIFSSTTLPTVTTSSEEVLLTSSNMAVVVCTEETSNGGLHEATNTFARSRSGRWYMVGHQAGPVMK
eukprot:s2079_g2.t1